MTDNLPAHPEAERFALMNDVMEMYVKNTSVAQIAREKKITRHEVEKIISEWRTSAVGSEFLKDRVDELMVLMDEHFSTLIQEGWKTLNEVDEHIAGEGISAPMLGARTSAIKTIADLEAKRVETLQKAGLLEAADLGDELSDMEERQDKIIAILRDVSQTCPTCRMEVARRLSDITGQAEGVEVEVVD